MPESARRSILPPAGAALIHKAGGAQPRLPVTPTGLNETR
jgi:hypothetical protein